MGGIQVVPLKTTDITKEEAFGNFCQAALELERVAGPVTINLTNLGLTREQIVEYCNKPLTSVEVAFESYESAINKFFAAANDLESVYGKSISYEVPDFRHHTSIGA